MACTLKIALPHLSWFEADGGGQNRKCLAERQRDPTFITVYFGRKVTCFPLPFSTFQSHVWEVRSFSPLPIACVVDDGGSLLLGSSPGQGLRPSGGSGSFHVLFCSVTFTPPEPSVFSKGQASPAAVNQLLRNPANPPAVYTKQGAPGT